MVITRKIKTAYFCTRCGAEHPKWQGQCRECNEWNSLVEERIKTTKSNPALPESGETRKIPDIGPESRGGIASGIDEFDRVLGGKLLPGMTVLLGGEPGIGKSTLILQLAGAYSQQGLAVLYVTGEESLPQIKMRSERLNVEGVNITVMNSTSLEEINEELTAGNYAIVFVDSVQTVTSSMFDSPAGTVAQVRECANCLIARAKANSFSLLLIGHVTKDGMVAGPKVLEHMVDTVIYFEGDSSHVYRILRPSKNRFGSVAEIGIFEMQPQGLIEVINPSSLFLSDSPIGDRSGSVVTSICEGTRPILVEVQALVTAANFGTPQRVAGGINHKRLALLLAILEKRCDYPMASNDVFVSIAGGLKLTETAIDLALLMAIVSSLLNKTIDHKTLVVGEVGLSGEIRGVSMIDRRVAEAARMGYTSVVLPEINRTRVDHDELELIGVSEIQSALEHVLT